MVWSGSLCFQEEYTGETGSSKMSVLDQLNAYIFANLTLLKHSGHDIEFHKEMFTAKGIQNFEKVGDGLLKIIKPEEHVKQFSSPLITKTDYRKFHIKFCDIVKKISLDHPELELPILQPSVLKNPTGETFLRFVYKLSAYALEFELKKILRVQGSEELLPRPIQSKQRKDQEIKMKIVQGARFIQERSLYEVMQYKDKASQAIQHLKGTCNELEKTIELQNKEMDILVRSLNINEEQKKNLLDLDNCDFIEEYNRATEAKVKELESQSERILQHKALAAGICKKFKSIDSPKATRVCIDGHQPEFIKALGCDGVKRFMNQDGDIRILDVLKSCPVGNLLQGWVEKAGSSKPLSQQAKELLSEAIANKTCSSKSNVVMDSKIKENKQVICKLQPILVKSMENKSVPQYFKYFKKRPNPNFMVPPYSMSKKSAVKGKRGKRKSLNTTIQEKKTFSCSIKNKESLTGKPYGKVKIYKSPKTLTSKSQHSNVIKPLEWDSKPVGESSFTSSSTPTGVKARKSTRGILVEVIKKKQAETNTDNAE